MVMFCRAAVTEGRARSTPLLFPCFLIALRLRQFLLRQWLQIVHSQLHGIMLHNSSLPLYCDAVANSLPAFSSFVAECPDPCCNEHHSLIDEYCRTLANCLLECASVTLPKICKSSTRKPGWNDAARDLKIKANFWHTLWKECGCPQLGVLHQIKKCTRLRYKYEVRRLKRRNLHLRKEKMATALSDNRTRDFWGEVRLLLIIIIFTIVQ